MGVDNIDMLINRAQVLRDRNIHQAMSLLDEALILAQERHDKAGMARIIFNKAICYLSEKNFKRALTGLNESLLFYKDLNDLNGQLSCLSEISAAYFKLSDIPSALHYILETLRLHNESGDLDGVAQCYHEIGRLYSYLHEYPNAIDHYKKSLKIQEKLKNKKEMIQLYIALGNAYMQAEDHDKSLYYLLRAANSPDQNEDADTKVRTIGALATLYTKSKEFDKALAYFNEAMHAASEGASPYIRACLKKDLGKLYIELTQYDRAIEVLSKALATPGISSNDSQLCRIHELLGMAYDKIGDHQNALTHYRKFFEQERTVISEEVNLKTKSLHIKYDLEELKKQKEIAELSDKLKEQFLANVSHEIRTPMNGVLGMTHLLSRTNPTKEQEEYIDAIRTSANNLMVIINDILDFSKINAGKIEFSENEFDLRSLVKGIVQILQGKADEKKIQIGCTVDYQIKDNLTGDPIRLNQILINLLGNAVKFTEKGKVQLDIKLLEQADHKMKLRFRVKDTGIGIPENKLQTIFESFEQAENSKRRYEGTGLGLTIVKQLVELQGGQIQVKSRVHEGSEFTVDMEFGIGKTNPKIVLAPQSAPDQSIHADYSGVNILIVEDNRVNQLLVKNILKKFGFTRFDTAENGKTALQKLREHDYDLVLMDIQMPVMDGYEITREIRNKLRKEVRSVPIIALTADASDKEKEKAREAGMDDYIVKPYTPEELFQCITKFLKADAADGQAPARKMADSSPVHVSEPGINLEFLEKYTGGDQELTIQLIEIFLKQVPDALHKLDYYVSRKDWKEVHAIAHKVKSSVAIFELSELKKIITNIEEFSRDGENLPEIPRLSAHFREGCRHAIRNLEAELKKLKELSL